MIGIAIPILILLPEGSLEALSRTKILVAAALFFIGALTDFWDGWIARRQRIETAFGRVLDPTADKIFILSTMASFAALGLYSYWFLVPLFLREIAVTYCRISWLVRGKAIGAERAGKVKLVLQVVSVSVSFLYLLGPKEFLSSLNHLVLLAAVVATLYSGIFFFVKNRILLRDQTFLMDFLSLGVGRWKPFPGTYGSLLGLLVVPLVAFDFWLHSLILTTFIALTCAALSKLKLSEGEDPLEIVMDEFCGILLAFWTVPISWSSLFVGFFLFRFFDVTKIFPIRWLEMRKGVNSILWDDLGAGVYTWLLLKILFR